MLCLYKNPLFNKKAIKKTERNLLMPAAQQKKGNFKVNKSYKEINEKIQKGQAVVLTAEEMIQRRALLRLLRKLM